MVRLNVFKASLINHRYNVLQNEVWCLEPYLFLSCIAPSAQGFWQHRKWVVGATPSTCIRCSKSLLPEAWYFKPSRFPTCHHRPTRNLPAQLELPFSRPEGNPVMPDDTHSGE